MRGRMLLVQSSRYLAVMTRTILTEVFNAWSMIVAFISVYDFIAFVSFVWPKWACIDLLISLHSDQRLSAHGFVIAESIATKFGSDQENIWSLRFGKFHLNPSNFIAWNQRWFKLDSKKVTLTVFRSAVDKGLIQKVNIFCMETGHVHAVNTLIKNRANWMRASCWFSRLKKIGHYFCRRMYIAKIWGLCH